MQGINGGNRSDLLSRFDAVRASTDDRGWDETNMEDIDDTVDRDGSPTFKRIKLVPPFCFSLESDLSVSTNWRQTLLKTSVICGVGTTLGVAAEGTGAEGRTVSGPRVLSEGTGAEGTVSGPRSLSKQSVFLAEGSFLRAVGTCLVVEIVAAGWVPRIKKVRRASKCNLTEKYFCPFKKWRMASSLANSFAELVS